MSSSKEYHRRRILIRTMMLQLLYATKISAAIRSKASCPAIRQPYSKSNGQCRGAAFVALDRPFSKSYGYSREAAFAALDYSCHQQRRKQQPIMRYEKYIRQSCSTQLKSAHTSTTHQQQQQQHENINSRQQNRQFYQNNNNPSLITILQSRINNLTSHPAVIWDESDSFASMQKKKLSRRHLHLFDGKRRSSGSNDTSEIAAAAAADDDDDDDDESNTVSYRDDLFDQFATAVCHAGVVARKEVFETWAAALYIHYTFLSTDISSSSSIRRPITKRIVDVAAGHGLLAWALLLLSHEEERNNNNNSLAKESCQPLTVFCLDVQMPPSAELIQHSMIQQWPHLLNRFDYVEARLEQLVPHPSCLLASVHACGILSDVLVATAAEYQMPLALVPCCHSLKRRLLENCASPFAKREYDEIMNAKKRLPNLADLLDEARMTALENAGCDVREVFIPEIFTGKNRLIIGSPSRTQSDALASSSVSGCSDRSPFRKGRMPPLLDNDEKISTSRSAAINPKARFLKGFYVPCEDTTNSRNIVSEIAGRAAANKRKELMHNRNHVNAPQMDLSIWLPPQDTEVGDGGVLNEQSLTRILEKMSLECVMCEVIKLGDVYINPAGRKSQSFRVQYNRVDGETLSFDEAKRIHAQLRDAVPIQFSGAECR